MTLIFLLLFGLLFVETPPSETIATDVRKNAYPSDRVDLEPWRDRFPDIISEWESQCNGTIEAMYYTEASSKKASFVCWESTDENGLRSGPWLGVLPVSDRDPHFVRETWTCSEGNDRCQGILSQVRSRYPDELEAAEFRCATRKGTLFFEEGEGYIDLRCGFFGTYLSEYDEENNYESFGSASVSVGRFQLDLPEN